MGDMGDDFRAMREQDLARKAKNLASHQEMLADGNWTKHGEHHYSRILAGHRLDFWPSRNKFQYLGTVMTGDIVGFIRNRDNDGV